MRLVLLLVVVTALPAQAQRGGCGFGQALGRLRDVDRLLAAAPDGLVAGRQAALVMAGRLSEASATLAGCGCREAAGHAAEARSLAEQAVAEASVARLRVTLERAGFSARLARERLDRQGCS